MLLSIAFLVWRRSNSNLANIDLADMETMLPDQSSSLGWDLETSLMARLQIWPLLPIAGPLGSHSAFHYDNYAEEPTAIPEQKILPCVNRKALHLSNRKVMIITEYKIKPAFRKLSLIFSFIEYKAFSLYYIDSKYIIKQKQYSDTFLSSNIRTGINIFSFPGS